MNRKIISILVIVFNLILTAGLFIGGWYLFKYDYITFAMISYTLAILSTFIMAWNIKSYTENISNRR